MEIKVRTQDFLRKKAKNKAKNKQKLQNLVIFSRKRAEITYNLHKFVKLYVIYIKTPAPTEVRTGVHFDGKS